jgi:hypothetical protein
VHDAGDRVALADREQAAQVGDVGLVEPDAVAELVREQGGSTPARGAARARSSRRSSSARAVCEPEAEASGDQDHDGPIDQNG